MSYKVIFLRFIDICVFYVFGMPRLWFKFRPLALGEIPLSYMGTHDGML